MTIEKILGDVATEVRTEKKKERSWLEWIIENALFFLSVTPQGRTINVIRRALASSWARRIALDAFLLALTQYAGSMLEHFIAGGSNRDSAEVKAAYIWFIGELLPYNSSVRQTFFLLLKNAVEDVVWQAFTDYLIQVRGNSDGNEAATIDDALSV
ncbi:MAG: hypothetical protein ACRBBN_10270 [Methyloligellaceae bacterium]